MAEFRHLSVDGVVTIDGELVFLKRNKDPFKGFWVLPGGMVEFGETAKQAVKREIMEELGLKAKVECLIGLFDAVDRDPRGNVSIAFLCESKGKPEAREEAEKVSLFSFNDLPVKIGFDHRKIVEEAKKSLKP